MSLHAGALPPWQMREVITQHEATIARLTAENERLRAALTGMIDLAGYWINLGSEPHMCKERYETWLVLGHRSKAMREARAALQEPQE